jgi:hypothetical protein
MTPASPAQSEQTNGVLRTAARTSTEILFLNFSSSPRGAPERISTSAASARWRTMRPIGWEVISTGRTIWRKRMAL